MPRIFETQDGSHSIFSEKYSVGYHSKYGAVQESRHVFMEAALHFKALLKKELAVLEIGFGTGLNAFMTYLEAKELQLTIRYVAVEAYPVSLKQAERLNYPNQLNAQDETASFLKMHCSDWETVVQMNNFFTFEKVKRHFETISYQNQFDIIYFDAFDPDAQPELWERKLLQKMYDALLPGGILVTYCAKGAVKRTLKAVGFEIESLKGPPGKREMTRASKNLLVPESTKER